MEERYISKYTNIYKAIETKIEKRKTSNKK
jgi:hypothetical protein